jgi:two-component system, response regulator PdtaR
MTLKIVVVEDEPMIAENIAEICAEAGHNVCDIAYNAGQALLAVQACDPDLVLLDINLQDELDGLEIGEKITNEWQIPIIYITSYSGKEILRQLNTINPLTYIVKPFHPAQLSSSLEVAAMKIKRNKTELNLQGIDLSKYELSDREKEIVKLIIGGADTKILQEKLFISANTVKYHLKNLYTKFNVHSKAELMAKVMKN